MTSSSKLFKPSLQRELFMNFSASNYQKELQTAVEAAKLAGDHIKKIYNSSFTVEYKSKEQPITEADRGSNEIIKSIIDKNFPLDGWLSEETLDTADRLQKKRVWIIDPLDGTKEFISHVPEFAVSIGLSVDGKSVVGVIYNPITDELLAGALGHGATLNNKTIHVTSNTSLNTSRILASRSELARNEWKPFEGEFEIIPSGGMAHKIATVAAGKATASFSLSPKNEWDFCGGTIIIEEAGGQIGQKDGTPFTFNKANPLTQNIVYGPKTIFAELVKKLERY